MIPFTEYPPGYKERQKVRFPMLTVAVGDVHGCLDQLMQLMEVVQKNVVGSQYKFVFLGDYIDRGLKSKEVIDYLMELDNRSVECLDDKFKHVFLRGNHEDMALEQGPNFRNGRYNGFANWMQNGGDRTLASYGFKFTPEFWQGLNESKIDLAMNSMLKEHKDWLHKTSLYHKDSQRTYVHAGLVRSIPIEEQDSHTLTWIRDPFLHNQSPKGGYIVHGHTPVKAVDMKPNRINIDTGCVFGFDPKRGYGNSDLALSAAVFNEEKPEPIMILNHRGQVYDNFVDDVHV